METVLEHLTKPNAALKCIPPWTTPTVNNDWPPIENIAEWSDFTFQNLTQRYASDLSRQTQFHDPVPHYMEAGLNELYSERSVSDALCSTNMFNVTYNLPRNLFIADGSRTLSEMDITPDWGAGNKTKLNKNGRSRALVTGETKYLWPYREAISMIKRNRHGYEGVLGKEVVRPLEQVQYYGMKSNSCYQFIITAKDLVIVRLHLSPDPVRTSPRPQRTTRMLGQHQRIMSNSTISEVASSVSAMSIDDKTFLPEISLLEYTAVPFEGRKDGMTVNLALYFIIQLANENNELRQDYDSLSPPLRATIQTSQPSRSQGTASSKGSSIDPKGKGKATDTTDKPGPTSSHPVTKASSAQSKFQEVKVSFHGGKFYAYKLGNEFFADPVDEWKQTGNHLYNFKKGLRSQIPM